VKIACRLVRLVRLGLTGWSLTLLVGGACGAELAPAFTLTNHVTGQPTSLRDFAGSVMLLEFFNAYCSHCQQATPQIESGIHDDYQARGGTQDGFPVTVVYVNETPDRQGTDDFIAAHGLDLVLDDLPLYSVLSAYGGSGYPHFVVINGVTNSTSHLPWQILYRGSGFNYTNDTLPVLHACIDSVRRTLPPELANARMLTNATFKAAFQAQPDRTNVVEATVNWNNWVVVTNLAGSNTTVRFNDPDAARFKRRFYRVRVVE
jgi:hypothetical protein